MPIAFPCHRTRPLPYEGPHGTRPTCNRVRVRANGRVVSSRLVRQRILKIVQPNRRVALVERRQARHRLRQRHARHLERQPRHAPEPRRELLPRQPRRKDLARGVRRRRQRHAEREVERAHGGAAVVGAARRHAHGAVDGHAVVAAERLAAEVHALRLEGIGGAAPRRRRGCISSDSRDAGQVAVGVVAAGAAVAGLRRRGRRGEAREEKVRPRLEDQPWRARAADDVKARIPEAEVALVDGRRVENGHGVILQHQEKEQKSCVSVPFLCAPYTK